MAERGFRHLGYSISLFARYALCLFSSHNNSYSPGITLVYFGLPTLPTLFGSQNNWLAFTARIMNDFRRFRIHFHWYGQRLQPNYRSSSLLCIEAYPLGYYVNLPSITINYTIATWAAANQINIIPWCRISISITATTCYINVLLTQTRFWNWNDRAETLSCPAYAGSKCPIPAIMGIGFPNTGSNSNYIIFPRLRAILLILICRIS